MDKLKIIEHWMSIVNAVFIAEHCIIDEWRPKLENMKYASSAEVANIKEAYIRAIAEEILRGTPKEKLEELYKNFNKEDDN